MLIGSEIRRRLLDRSGDPDTWLVITPLLNPTAQLRDQDASVDLRLASLFVVPNRAQLESLDPLAADYADRKEQYMDRIFVPIGREFVLHPRHFALAQTLEWIKLPKNLGAYVVGKSSWGREGLIVATATGVHPGWSGPLTLELTNLGEIPLLLRPGLAYVQLFLHLVSGGERLTKPKGQGRQFVGTTTPGGRPKHEKDVEILRQWETST